MFEHVFGSVLGMVLGWQTVEHWRGTTGHGAVWEVRLTEMQDIWAHAWRVEWWQPGHAQHPGRSFTGDTREADARAFLAQRMAEFGGDWHQVTAP